MSLSSPTMKQTSSRRDFLKASLFGAGGLALYSGEVERHWIDVAQRDVALRGLSADFEGMRIAQLSDIHMDNFTEPFFLRRVIERINELKPDAVFLTGDFVTSGQWTTSVAHEAAWQCAAILKGLECKSVYAILGNHDVTVGAAIVEGALRASGISVLRNSFFPLSAAAEECGLPDSTIPSSAIRISTPPFRQRYATFAMSP